MKNIYRLLMVFGFLAVGAGFAMTPAVAEDTDMPAAAANDGSPSDMASDMAHEKRAHGKKDRMKKKEEMMKKYDTDGDGKLSDTEKAAAKQDRMEMRKQRADKKFDKMDENKDGSVTREEFHNAAQKRMEHKRDKRMEHREDRMERRQDMMEKKAQ